ncbi:hypothetical protein F2Q70_00012526 [Brassica cretica]|uniref:DUF577 domain-containing protein n=1 Tax=Brassica cretica TaxID=69181 RepID=A0A8S9LVQ3_BRACR|nr:hypothetical protein F2Q70_00012526 [Brassica cretica]
MAESSLLMFSARDLLATPSHEGLAYFVEKLFKPHETYEYQNAQALYKFCVVNFSNCLTQMLLKVYLHSPDDLIRFRAISLLSEALTGLRNRSFELSPVALDVIKPLLVSCLTMPEAKKPDTKMLRRIVSCVARNAMKLDPHGWDELGDCMLTLVNTDPVRAFNVFLDLPQLHVGFINRFFKHLIEEIEDTFKTCHFVPEETNPCVFSPRKGSLLLSLQVSGGFLQKIYYQKKRTRSSTT